jgi:hypothetical protein
MPGTKGSRQDAKAPRRERGVALRLGVNYSPPFPHRLHSKPHQAAFFCGVAARLALSPKRSRRPG